MKKPKFVDFTPENCPSTGGRSSAPSLSVGKTGIFSFSKGAVERISIKKGDRLVIRQDPEEKENWYVYNAGQGNAAKGFLAAEPKADDISGRLQFSSAGLRDKMKEAFGKDAVSQTGAMKFLVAGEKTEVNNEVMWGLLIRPAV